MSNLPKHSLIAVAVCLVLAGRPLSSLNAQQPRPVGRPAAGSDQNPVLELVTHLSEIGEHLAKARSPALIAAYNLQQADTITQIIAQSKPADRATWIRQLADCLLAAASMNTDSDRIAMSRLTRLQQQLDRTEPGSSLTAYVTLQVLQAEYLTSLYAPGVDLQKVQVEWCHRLDTFVQTYPESEATPRALHEMALTSEALAKHENARRCCHYLVEHFPKDPLAAEAKRLLHWMDLDGRVLHLALPLLLTEDERFDAAFDIETLRGKLVIVYFWKSSMPNWRECFAALRKARAHYHDKGVEVLCVNMDETPKEARDQVRDSEAPGIQVFQRKGVDGYAGRRLGLPELPAMLLVGRDGRVVERVAGLGQLGLHVGKQLEREAPVIRVSDPPK
jgi:thioredoxin-like negative regulator of GroEL